MCLWTGSTRHTPGRVDERERERERESDRERESVVIMGQQKPKTHHQATRGGGGTGGGMGGIEEVPDICARHMYDVCLYEQLIIMKDRD